MRHRLSIRWVLTLTVVGISLTAMIIVSSVYSATATTMFNQLGLSNMLQAMAQVSDKLSDHIGQVTSALNNVAKDIEETENFNASQFLQGVRISAGTGDSIAALLFVDEYGKPILGLPSGEIKEGGGLTGMDWFQQAREAEVGQMVFSDRKSVV